MVSASAGPAADGASVEGGDAGSVGDGGGATASSGKPENDGYGAAADDVGSWTGRGGTGRGGTSVGGTAEATGTTSGGRPTMTSACEDAMGAFAGGTN